MNISAAPAPAWLVTRALHGPNTANPAPRQAAPRKNHARTSAYGQAALDQELEAVRTAPEGTRNETLNKAAFALGQLIAGGEIDRAEVEAELISAAIEVGLGEDETRKTIRSGMQAGAREPRIAPDPPPRHRLVAISGGRQEGPEGEDPADCLFSSHEIMDALNRPEAGDADLLKRLFKGRLCFDHASQDWFVWTGHHWALDRLNEHVKAVDELVDNYLAEARRMGRRSEEAVRQ
ncbi:MAG: hypothetical protein ABIM40_01885 [Pseudomonadota bacterium]